MYSSFKLAVSGGCVRTAAAISTRRQLHVTSMRQIEMKLPALPKITSIKYTIPTDAYLLANKFREVSRQDKLNDAVAIVMQSKTSSQSVVVWNLVIDAYAKTGRLGRALRAFTEMKRRGFKPTPSTYTALFKACSLSDSENAEKIAQEIFDGMKTQNVEPTVINVNSLLSVYQRKHNLDELLRRFNEMSATGPEAPTLATYTVVMSALRRELSNRLADLKETNQSNKYDNANEFSVKRRVALKKQHVHRIFDALMQTWTTYTEDAVHRMSGPRDDTPLLHLDVHIVYIVLKACHAVYGENRPLGRQGLKIAEQVYGFGQVSSKTSATNNDSKKPLALRIYQATAASAGSDGAPVLNPIIDSTVIDLVLDLCTRDGELTKATRFWRSLETNFEPLVGEFSDETRAKYQAILDKRAKA
ncbi:hypothetical protein GGI15_001851 [Coemansia interrupta]|uniref:Pentatricopeptide repeat-containing protein n=1 Tax=Coemansia interrupta TaxID=1126814 RepID=A0A9W8HI70_9FUNG|nr:hypothetical protein GGI15_001851 [Coemansia interrupta]